MSDDFNFEIDDILSEFLNDTNNVDKEKVVNEVREELNYDYEMSNISNNDKTVAFKTEQRHSTKASKITKVGNAKKYEEERVHPIIRERRREPFVVRATKSTVGLVFALLSALMLLWAAVNIHPASAKKVNVVLGAKTDLVSKIDNVSNNAKSDAFLGLSAIKKIYKIAENAVAAPTPDPYGFNKVSVSDASKVMSVIQSARDRGLLEEDENTVFNPDADFYYDSDIGYYLDDTILVICWKEVIDGNTCTFSEVKVADASQFRRKFVNDTFSADAQDYATNIAKSVNAVVAMNADYYAFRNFGIVVYQRNLFRFNEDTYLDSYKNYNCVDTAFVDENGDFKFFHRGEESTPNAMEKYIKDNNILFSIAFGPVLVENGELQYCDWYPAGEVNTGYSRAGIGQISSLHYLYMSLNHSPEKAARWTVNQFAQHFYDKGVVNAYCLDGGQTSEVVFMDEPFNYIDFNAERTVTDIIYFGTALDTWEGYY